jgi:hypothetical protein
MRPTRVPSDLSCACPRPAARGRVEACPDDQSLETWSAEYRRGLAEGLFLDRAASWTTIPGRSRTVDGWRRIARAGQESESALDGRPETAAERRLRPKSYPFRPTAQYPATSAGSSLAASSGRH